ncbi:site-specific integrase [uncultured Bacteroides sp.]|uniref:tyrosine-type recombinase/integrase n=1 Tax=uncultured Bacteroides sp. TaxID=162156 RepID=UPI002AAAC068|nr:site-specific integrase [uncultured Bacteroides sp.]
MKGSNLLKAFTTKLCSELLASGRHATARSYESALKRLLLFTKRDEISFSDLNLSLLMEYEQHLLAEGCKRNTISLYMRMLRSICNQAKSRIKAEIPSGLFDYVFTGTETCYKRAVTPRIIHKLYECELNGTFLYLNFAKDLFLLSFYLRGIPFVDLAHLRKSDIRGNVLTYNRSKTGSQLIVTLEPCALAILRKYALKVQNSPYLLPIITRIGEDEYKQYQSALRLYNMHLRKLSKLLGLKKNLTSYVARHSWATAAYHKGVPVSVISESLGHSSEKVTYNYLASFDNRTLKRANQKVLALVFSSSTGGSHKLNGRLKINIRDEMKPELGYESSF